MLSDSLVAEIRRLLDDGRLSQRAIARKLGVSRGSVDGIASGRRIVSERDADDETMRCKKRAPRRCCGCGGLVYLPCLLCRARAYRQRTRVARLVEAVAVSQRKKLCRGGSLSREKDGGTLEPLSGLSASNIVTSADENPSFGDTCPFSPESM
jgi:hypothetical protein